MTGNEKLAIPYLDAAEEIGEMIEKGRLLQNVEVDFEKDLEQAKDEYQLWTKDNEKHLLRIFASDDEAKKYKDSFSLILKRKVYLSDMVKDFRQLVESKVTLLEAIVNRLTIVTDIDFDIHDDEIFGAAENDVIKVLVVRGSKKISDSVAKVLGENGVEAIIIKNKKTIIDNLAEHENVDHFIVIASNEDVGAQKSKKSDLKPRAGQNTILELGYILGKYEKNKLTVLLEKDVELPNGLKEISTIMLTGKNWQSKLANEIEALNRQVNP